MKKFHSGTIILTLLLILQSQTVIGQSPYSLKNSREIILVGGGLVLVGFGQYLNSKNTPLAVNDINRLSADDGNRFDRNAIQRYSRNAARLSDILLVSTMCAENLLLVNSFSLITRGLVRRIRPYVYNPDAPLEEKLSRGAAHSFYSGHTTNAFASAVFFSVVYNDYFPDSRWKTQVWVGSLGSASLVGYLRYRAGRHFPSDIITGALVGSVVGFVVPYLHRQKNTNLSGSPRYQSNTLTLYLSFGLN
ncbi:MAG: phosphatase PAP2 family protein [Calditrichota bacterium]